MKTSTSPRPSPHFAVAKRGEGETLPASFGILPLAIRAADKDSGKMHPRGYAAPLGLIVDRNAFYSTENSEEPA